MAMGRISSCAPRFAISLSRRAALVRHRQARASVDAQATAARLSKTARTASRIRVERSKAMAVILRFIVGLVTFFIGIVVMKVVLGIIGVALKLIFLVLVVAALALVGYVVYKIMFPQRAEHVCRFTRRAACC